MSVFFVFINTSIFKATNKRPFNLFFFFFEEKKIRNVMKMLCVVESRRSRYFLVCCSFWGVVCKHDFDCYSYSECFEVYVNTMV